MDLNNDDALLFSLYKQALEAMRSTSHTVDCLKRQLEVAERESTEAMRAFRCLVEYMRSSNRKNLIAHIEEWEEVDDE